MKISFQTKWKEANRCQVDLQRKKMSKKMWKGTKQG
jgi:hypothetical protein